MAIRDRASLDKAINTANMLMGMGILLSVVPLGLTIVSLFTSQGETAVRALVALGWSFLVAAGLLPIGLALFVGGLGWIYILKKARRAIDLAEADAEEKLG